MALLVAPYNPAMRLGMGFNSFTQQLCVNDTVRPKDDTNPAAAAKLIAQRPKYDPGLMDAKDSTGAAISQSVTWTAKFVDRMSEVTDSMNVSGSLQIKCDAIGGGGGAGASFLDSNKFKESDINYFIQVKVTNQQLVAPDLTEFNPIPGVHEADFTRVYGDSFISGFIEGGEFNALISIKLADRSKAKDISGQLKVAFDVKAAKIEGEAQAKIQNSLNEHNCETTISVSWVGGGDIKDEKVNDWTLETLKNVALEFPEHVMACPMRTSAILTKYTSLKSFHEQKTGSPLDYEAAGVYSSALLDAYMDYKVMWRNIQQAAWEVEQGQSSLEARPKLLQFQEISRQAQAHYEAQLTTYKQKMIAYEKAAAKEVTADETPSEDTDIHDSEPVSHVVAKYTPFSKEPEAPFPPNALEPYSNDIFGLEKARRDCRFEMIKIVREVDAVTEDPKVAINPERTWQYLSPAVFRMLLPTVTNLKLEEAAEKAKADAKAVADADAADKADKAKKLAETEKKLADTEAALKALIPYVDWCPVDVDKPVRMRSAATNKSMDYNTADPALPFRQWDSNSAVRQWDGGVSGGFQEFTISRVGRGFYIRHKGTGRCVAEDVGNVGDGGRIYTAMRDVGSVFYFEQAGNGTIWMHLADKPQYVLLPENVNSANGTKYILWPHNKGDAEKWVIEAFA